MNNKTDLNSKYIPKPSIPQESELKKNLFPKYQYQEEILKNMRKQKIKFSFHFLNLDDPLFNCNKVNLGWFNHLFSNLQHISNLNRDEFNSQRQHYDVHPLKWEKSNYTKKHFDNVPPQILEEIDASDQLQFRLSSSSGRVHGFFIINTFYIVWFDPHHNLDIDYRFGGAKYYDAPISPYQELEILYHEKCTNYDKLSDKHKELEEYSYNLLEQLESKKPF